MMTIKRLFFYIDKKEVDCVEAAVVNLGISSWQVFEEACRYHGEDKGRDEMFFDGYITEDFIPDFVYIWCLFVLT